MANTNSLLGELLVDWQLASRQQMETAVSESLNRNLPLGLVLTMLDVRGLRELCTRRSRRSLFLRDHLISADQTTQAMNLVRKKHITVWIGDGFARHSSRDKATQPAGRLSGRK